jgi:hypothetical protein
MSSVSFSKAQLPAIKQLLNESVKSILAGLKIQPVQKIKSDRPRGRVPADKNVMVVAQNLRNAGHKIEEVAKLTGYSTATIATKTRKLTKGCKMSKRELEIMQTLRNEGHTAVAIAKIMNCSDATVVNNSIPSKTIIVKSKKSINNDVVKVMKNLRVHGFTLDFIGKMTGVTQTTVFNKTENISNRRRRPGKLITSKRSGELLAKVIHCRENRAA